MTSGQDQAKNWQDRESAPAAHPGNFEEGSRARIAAAAG
jgi:hypothetical protein